MLSKIAIALVKFYRNCISPLKKPCCRFYPTCSEYALQAFKEWGFFRGLGLSCWRILRCNPFCRGGYDPIPVQKYAKRKKGVSTPNGDVTQCK
ncbi:MAG: membrane protein insertion efficiency factor YidD [Clostridiales bacterium]|nr:membrane protein insertion efficiency factor YidD [Clostridiales bacterium]